MSILLDIITYPFARLLRLDEYPNQPEIPDWPITDVERVELQTLEALGDYYVAVQDGAS